MHAFHQLADFCGGASTQVQPFAGGLLECAQSGGLVEVPDPMMRWEVPLDGQPCGRAPQVPVMGDIGADQHQVARFEQFDVIRDEAGSIPLLDKGQLGLRVIMPVIALALHRNRLAGRREFLDFADVMIPAQQAEGLPTHELDVLPGFCHQPHYCTPGKVLQNKKLIQ